jgi:hypothetical protein
MISLTDTAKYLPTCPACNSSWPVVECRDCRTKRSFQCPGHGQMLAEDMNAASGGSEGVASSKLEDLTPDLLLSVFRHLDARGLVRAGATCAQWRSLASTDALWQQAWQVCSPAGPAEHQRHGKISALLIPV